VRNTENQEKKHIQRGREEEKKKDKKKEGKMGQRRLLGRELDRQQVGEVVVAVMQNRSRVRSLQVVICVYVCRLSKN
jgi:hypothetical protein